jgi:hypothetical protein
MGGKRREMGGNYEGRLRGVFEMVESDSSKKGERNMIN